MVLAVAGIGGGVGTGAQFYGIAGTVNTGSGGGGSKQEGDTGGSGKTYGGSGLCVLKYPDSRTISIGAGLTGSTASASGGTIVTTITAGTGKVSWL